MSKYQGFVFIRLRGQNFDEWRGYVDDFMNHRMDILGSRTPSMIIDTDTVGDYDDVFVNNVFTQSHYYIDIALYIEDLLKVSVCQNLRDRIRDVIFRALAHSEAAKIEILGHGSTDARIGAYTKCIAGKRQDYKEVGQADFINQVFPDLDAASLQTVKNITMATGVRKTISLRQCSAGRTRDHYAAWVASADPQAPPSLQAPDDSAVNRTAQALIAKNWGGSGVHISASPQVNIVQGSPYPQFTASTPMPIVSDRRHPTNSSVPLAACGRIVNGPPPYIETNILPLTYSAPNVPKFVVPGTVFYPDSWYIEKVGIFTWKIYIPEYVEVQAAGNTHNLSLRAGVTLDNTPLKRNDLKIRVTL